MGISFQSWPIYQKVKIAIIGAQLYMSVLTKDKIKNQFSVVTKISGRGKPHNFAETKNFPARIFHQYPEYLHNGPIFTKSARWNISKPT